MPGEPTILLRFSNAIPKHFCHKGRECISDLNTLLLARPLKFQLVRKCLYSGSFTNSQGSIQERVNRQRIMAWNHCEAWFLAIKTFKNMAKVPDLISPIANRQFLGQAFH